MSPLSGRSSLPTVPLDDVAAPIASWPLRRTSALALGAQLVGIIAAFVAFSTVTGDPATSCGWCESNAFDEAVRRLLVANDPRGAAQASHALSIGLAPLLALGGTTLPALTSARRWHAAQNAAVIVNAFLLTTAITDGVKKLADRERPGFHHGRGALLEAAHTPLERYLSFFSGDTAWAFTFAAAGYALSTRRGYRHARPVAVAGLIAAAAVAALRVAADMHWATDVMTGALVGTLVGAALPAWLHPREA